MTTKFELKETYNNITCIAYASHGIAYASYEEKVQKACVCKVGYGNSGSSWVISSWFTEEAYQNQGLGRMVLQRVLIRLYEKFGEPDTIEYIWNGANGYVLEWMEKHFDAKCLCPLVVQKTQAGDDWLSHVYDLDVGKVLSYFKVK